MSNRHNLQAAIDEDDRKKRALMSDTYNLACSRNVPSTPYAAEHQAEQTRLMREELDRQMSMAGLPIPPTYPVADDSGQRLRRSDKPAEKVSDPVNQPAHYTGHPSGVECIAITEHMSFNLGNALKYIWRCDLKADALEDLRKAEFYIKREIAKREKAAA